MQGFFMFIKKELHYGLCKLQIPCPIRQESQVPHRALLAVPHQLLPRLEVLFEEPFRRRAHRPQGKVQLEVKEKWRAMPATFNFSGSFPLQGQDDECETLLPTASRLRFVQVPNADLDYVKKHLTFSRLSSIYSLRLYLTSRRR